MAGTSPGAFGADRAPGAANDPGIAHRLRQILKEGLDRKTAFSRIDRQVAEARQIYSHEPSLEYAYGLILRSRQRHGEAAGRFDAALRIDKAFAPAWKSLIRLRLADKSADALCDQLVLLAETLAKPQAGWKADERRELATWLGRVHGFLGLPEVDVVDPSVLKTHTAIVGKRLPVDLHAAYEGGVQAVVDEYEDGLAEIAANRQAAGDKAASDLKRLGEQDRQIDTQAEVLQRTRQQWASWLGDQLNASEGRLQSLQKDYQALENADRKLSILNAQTTLDRQRLRTDYSLRGLSAEEIDVQPAVLRLEQELLRYQNEHLSLQQQAARLVATVRTVLAARAAAMNRYQQATGDLQRKDATLDRWKKALDGSSLKVKQKVVADRSADRMRKRLSRPESYLEMDVATQADRLLTRFGTSLNEELSQATAAEP